MALRLIFTPAIPDDLAAADEYYEELSPALANRFRTNVNRRLDEIAERPESFAMDEPPVRFAKVAQFPYLIFFAAKTDFVSIIAIVHGASEPDKWRHRV